MVVVVVVMVVVCVFVGGLIVLGVICRDYIFSVGIYIGLMYTFITSCIYIWLANNFFCF